RFAYDVSRETVWAASRAVSGVSAPLQHPASATVKWSFIEAKSFHESRRKVPLRILRLAHAVSSSPGPGRRMGTRCMLGLHPDLPECDFRHRRLYRISRRTGHKSRGRGFFSQRVETSDESSGVSESRRTSATRRYSSE